MHGSFDPCIFHNSNHAIIAGAGDGNTGPVGFATDSTAGLVLKFIFQSRLHRYGLTAHIAIVTRGKSI